MPLDSSPAIVRPCGLKPEEGKGETAGAEEEGKCAGLGLAGAESSLATGSVSYFFFWPVPVPWTLFPYCYCSFPFLLLQTSVQKAKIACMRATTELGCLSRGRPDLDCGKARASNMVRMMGRAGRARPLTHDGAQRTLEDEEVRNGTARARVRCDCARHRRLPCLSAQSRAHSTAHLSRLGARESGSLKLASIWVPVQQKKAPTELLNHPLPSQLRLATSRDLD
jgi:hypothetical protein